MNKTTFSASWLVSQCRREHFGRNASVIRASLHITPYVVEAKNIKTKGGKEKAQGVVTK